MKFSFLFLNVCAMVVMPAAVIAAVPTNRPASPKSVNTVNQTDKPSVKVSDNVLRLAQQNAERLVNTILERFDTFEKRIQASSNFSDATKAELQKNIDADRAFVKAKLTDVQNAETPQELRAIIREVLDYMRNRKSQAQQYRDAAKKQFESYVATMEKKNDTMVKKIEGVIAKLNAKGFDTTTVTAALDDYKKAVTALRTLDITTQPHNITTALENVRAAFRALVAALQNVVATKPL